jgi:hypothetical protein
MPAKSVAQRRAMAIAEHHPSELYGRNKGLAKMSHSQLHDFAATKETKLPERKEHAPGNPGRLNHVHEHLQTAHVAPHPGVAKDGGPHDGALAGSLPEHKHEPGLIHHYVKGKGH